MKFLHIEDDPNMQKVVEERIRASNLSVREFMAVGTMHEARNVITHFQPNVILEDLTLPDSEPEDSLDAIPDLISTGATLFVVTGSMDENWWMKALALGAEGYLLKNIHLAPGYEASLNYTILNGVMKMKYGRAQRR